MAKCVGMAERRRGWRPGSLRQLRVAILVILAPLLLGTLPAQAQPLHPASLAGGGGVAPAMVPAEQRTARYFDAIRGQAGPLATFLERMPKGGDLHNHLSGAVYAESYIVYAAEDGLCVQQPAERLVAPTCSAAAGRPPAAMALGDPAFQRALVDAWSMQDFQPGAQSGHDHFFATFGDFGAATVHHEGDMLAEVAARAAKEHVSYLELMVTADGGAAGKLGTQLGWDGNLARFRQRLLASGMAAIVANARRNLDTQEATMRDRLLCETAEADPGCGVAIRYLDEAVRTDPPEQVFAQFVFGFELAQADDRMVGVNLVGAEDNPTALRDDALQMAMLDYLHGVYPTVHISLHAGELTPAEAAQPADCCHIRAAVEIGQAERIGHGVDIRQERDPAGLLDELAAKHVLVEVPLTSNAQVLGVQGAAHPFPLFLSHHVPVALATDDEGVSRIDLTHEFERATTTYDLGYAQLKQLARNSLTYSFLPGASLWRQADPPVVVPACAGAALGDAAPSTACRDFLAGSERAREQWQLEGSFAAFERSY